MERPRFLEAGKCTEYVTRSECEEMEAKGK
jgi:hypothetical protein